MVTYNLFGLVRPIVPFQVGIDKNVLGIDDLAFYKSLDVYSRTQREVNRQALKRGGKHLVYARQLTVVTLFKMKAYRHKVTVVIDPQVKLLVFLCVNSYTTGPASP